MNVDESLSIWQIMKQLRHSRGWTQQALADFALCSRQEISLMENGRFKGGFHRVNRVFEQLEAPLLPQTHFRTSHRANQSNEIEPIRILAIDDDPDILKGYRQTFEPNEQNGIQPLLETFKVADQQAERPKQYDIDTATSGKQGLELVKNALEKNRPYTLLLLDMRMSDGWDGLDTAQEVLKIAPDIRIIIVSAFRDYTLSKMREALGSNFVLHPKPYRQDELVQLAYFMGQRQMY